MYRTSERGSTLFEVVIAVVILGLVSFSFLNAASSNTRVEKIDNLKTNEQIALTSAAQLISGVPYELCNPYKSNPYASYESSFPANVKITSVQGRNRAGEWKPCDWSGWTIEGAIDSRGVLLDPTAPAALAQLIEISYCEPASETSLGTRPCGSNVIKASSYVSKTYRGSEGSDFKVSPASYQYQYGSAQSDICGLWWGGGIKINLDTLRKSGGSVSGYRYFIMQPGPDKGVTTSLSGNQLSVTTPRAQGSIPSKITFDIGSYNEQTLSYSTPTSLSLQMWPMLFYKADYKKPKVVPSWPALLPITVSGGGDQGAYSFSVGSTPSSFAFSGTSGTSTNLTWTVPPTPSLGVGGNSRTEDVPIKVKWNCWPALEVAPVDAKDDYISGVDVKTTYPVNFRTALYPGIKNGVIVDYAKTCTAFRTTFCTFTLTRISDYGSGETTGSELNWYLSSYSLFKVTTSGAITTETPISGAIGVDPILATQITGDEAIQTLKFANVNGNPCRSNPDNNKYRVKLNFVDTYYGQLRPSNATIVVDFTC